MANYEYKALVYAIEGKYTHSLRYWWDLSGKKAYGEKARARWIGGIATQMRQLESALKELDQEGWELVSYTTSLALPFTRLGSAIVRRPRQASQ